MHLYMSKLKLKRPFTEQKAQLSSRPQRKNNHQAYIGMIMIGEYDLAYLVTSMISHVQAPDFT